MGRARTLQDELGSRFNNYLGLKKTCIDKNLTASMRAFVLHKIGIGTQPTCIQVVVGDELIVDLRLPEDA